MYTVSELIASEKVTIDKTRIALKGIAENYPKVIDLLLAIPQIIERTEEELDKKENTFYYFAHYVQAHSTVYCIYKNYESGYYLEAIILLRHLLEAFIQMRYFRMHPDKLIEHITQQKRIHFKTMFEELSPGYYRRYYSQLLSEAAHGMAYKLIMRSVGKVTQSGGQLIIGNRYDENHATLVINYLTAVVSGYLNHRRFRLPCGSDFRYLSSSPLG